jgi:hypothetical protein
MISNMAHRYKVQLIRVGPQKDDRYKYIETVALEKATDNFADAIETAFKFGARRRKHGSELPKIEGTRAVYPCKDKRFARVQIIPAAE